MRLSGRTSASPEQDIVWRDEIGRRVVCSLVFTAAMVAVSAGIHPSDYNAAMWLVTILLRAVPTLILLIVCSMPDKQISPYWPGAVAFMCVVNGPVVSAVAVAFPSKGVFPRAPSPRKIIHAIFMHKYARVSIIRALTS